MAHWTSDAEVDSAAETICYLFERTGTVLPDIVEAYAEAMRQAPENVTRRVFDAVARRSPTALTYFSDFDVRVPATTASGWPRRLTVLSA